jgi:AcrR family transcriptional regulator
VGRFIVGGDQQSKSATVTTEGQKRLRLSPALRRAGILDAAQSLFLARGWDGVTIADLLTQAGISKGGFYHHFTAKEDLLDGVVERFTMQALASAQNARVATSGDALTCFNAFVQDSSRWKAELGPQMTFILTVMLRPGHDVLFDRITTAANAAARPVLMEMIAQGVQEDAFDVPDMDLVCDTILGLSQGRRAVLQGAFHAAKAGDLDKATSQLDHRMRAEGALIDRLLGLPCGSVTLSNPAEYRLMFGALGAGPI